MKIAYIDNKPYEIEAGETMLTFLKRHMGENPVPTLCDAPNLDPFGSCRVCSVDVALEEGGKTKAMASCHTPISEGMHILPVFGATALGLIGISSGGYLALKLNENATPVNPSLVHTTHSSMAGNVNPNVTAQLHVQDKEVYQRK